MIFHHTLFALMACLVDIFILELRVRVKEEQAICLTLRRHSQVLLWKLCFTTCEREASLSP